MRPARFGLIALLGVLAAPSRAPAETDGGSPSDAAQQSAGVVTVLNDRGESAQVTDIEQLDLEMLLGTVSAVSRRDESAASAPAAVTVLDAVDIRYAGALLVPDLLRRVPGVQVIQVAPGNYLVSMRGLGGLEGNNLVVLVDGVLINSRIDGSIDWSLLPVHTSAIKRIEVVRGPVSPIYGANAYAGVIHITTERPESAAAATLSAGLDTTGRPIAGVHARGGYTWARVSASAIASAGHDDAFTSTAEGRLPRLRNAGGSARVNVKVSEGASVQLDLGGVVSDHSTLGHLGLDARPLTSALLFGQGTFRLQGLPGEAVLGVSGRVRRLTTTSDLSAQGFNLGGIDSVDSELSADLELRPHARLRGLLGANGSLAKVSAPFIHALENNKPRLAYGGFVSGQWQIVDELTLSAAGRFDSSPMIPRPAFSYRASLAYLRSWWSLRLSGSSAYREPTYVEVGGQFIEPATGLILLEGTPLLRAPQVDSVELGAIVVPVLNFTLTPTVYVARLSNLIQTDFRPLVRKTFANDDSARVVGGFELEADAGFFGWSGTATASVLVWLQNTPNVTATFGTPEHNSAFMASLALRRELMDNHLGLGLSAGLATPRSYNVRVGIPQKLLTREVSTQAWAQLAADYKLPASLRAFLKGDLQLPYATSQAPFPGAADLVGRVQLGVEWRP